MRQRVLSDEVLQTGLGALTNETVPGHEAALVRVPLAPLTKSLGLRIQESYDGLDYVKLAVVELEDGEPVALLRHRGDPEDDTGIWLARPPRGLLDSVIGQLGITETAVVWLSPDLGH